MTEEVKLRESLLLLIKVAAARVSLDPLESILENAELVGSRGRARKYGRPEPEGRDYDYAVFSDDSEEQDRYLKLLRQLGGAGYKLRDRPGGFLTASGNNTDLSIYPTSKRDSIHEAWELMEGGMSKEDAWEHVNKQANDNSYLSTLAPKWSDKSHIVAALRDHLTDASGALDTELEAKEIADLALITDAYRRAHVSQELMDKRKAKFEEYAASPSLGQDDVYVQSAVPAASRDLVKKHGITSSGGIAPEYLDFGEKKAEDEENWYVAASKKAGKGLFAEKDFEVGEELFHAGDKDNNDDLGTNDWEMTEASMATNHDREPNARLVKDGDNLAVVAIKPINADDEVFVSYYQVTHAIGPGSRLVHNGKPVPVRSVDEIEKWAAQERIDWAGLVHGNA